ncbi:MAG: SIMPL domain-containing protein, partial [bacterium]
YNPQRGQELIGYRVTNQITVKIRDLSKIPTILGLAGKYGATEVGGLTFTIDDPENLKALAREKAMEDAITKAQKLSGSLGVRLGDVVGYSEYEGTDYYQPVYNKFIGAEGGGMSETAPASVAAGSKDVVMNNSIVFEIISP